MSKKALFIGLFSLYVLLLHVVIFFLYFEKVEFVDYKGYESFIIKSENEFLTVTESNEIHFGYGYADNIVSISKSRTLEFYPDSIAIITDYGETYNSVFFFSSKKNSFWGHLAKSRAYSKVYLVRGNCLVSPYDQVDKYISNDKAAEMRALFDNSGCKFKPTDAPSGIYRFERNNSQLNLYPG